MAERQPELASVWKDLRLAVRPFADGTRPHLCREASMQVIALSLAHGPERAKELYEAAVNDAKLRRN
jgi:hypothetical protein